MRPILIALTILVAIMEANAASWSGNIGTDSDSLHIYRHSINLRFDIEQSVSGTIAPIEGHNGRVLASYASYLENININDVRLQERTAALEGRYSSEELMAIRSNTDVLVNSTDAVISENGAHSISFYEKWPVRLYFDKAIKYSGLGINNKEIDGNNMDFVGTNLLYNSELSKKHVLKMSLDRFNITVLAAKEGVSSMEQMATRSLDSNISLHATGIADISYKQIGPMDEVLNEGSDRYYGAYDITKKIQMRSVFNHNNDTNSWLPCCSVGWSDMEVLDKKRHSADCVLDCSYNIVP